MNTQNADYLKGRLFPMILRFSIPAAVSLLITAIYNIVDRIFVGNYNGTSALAGLSVCFPLSFMMVAFALMCSAGGATFFSLFSGQNDTDSMNRSFGNAFVMVCFFEIALTILLLLLPDFLLNIFGVTKTSYPYAISYYKIVALGCLFQGLSMLFCDFVRVSGKPFLGMCVTAIGAVANIALDALFIILFDWGVVGAAAATVTGQILSALFGACLVFGKKTQVQISKSIFHLDKRLCAQILSCGFCFWVSQISMGFISLVYNSQLGKYGGDIAISVYAVVSSIMTFVIMPASGISQGIQPILGNNYGSGNHKRVMDTLWLATLFSVTVTCFIWLIVMILPKQILAAFGGTQEMFQIGVTGLRINFCITPLLGFVMLATTFFQSINRPNPSTIITLLRQVVFLVPFIYLFPVFFGINGIFIAQPISDGLATLLSLFLIFKEQKRMSL
ncbi:MATE family efflux transporter [Clostridiaceae bacterium]|nr:MATE family efflux transporter [Clostridiaceae bacterium]NBH35936.1 MATE family efflux transporter [Clostridiaceae bacterium]